MRKPEQSPEPSIEEILSSIRRIIADDGVQGNGLGPRTSQSAPLAAPVPPQSLEVSPPTANMGFPPQSEKRGGQRNEDEILELTEDSMVQEAARARLNVSEPATVSPSSVEPDDVDRSGHLFSIASTAGEADTSGLRNVLSSVADEVGRLADDERGVVGPADPYARSADFRPKVHEPNEPISAFEPDKPFQPNGEEEDVTANVSPSPATQPPRPSVRARPPIWSARRLEGDAGGSPAAEIAETATQREERAPEFQPQPQNPFAGRDRWEEGV